MLVHSRPGFHRGDGFRGWRAVAQGTVWSLGVVVFPPLFNQDLRLSQAVEDLTVQQLVPESGIEAFTVSILPRRTRFDVGGLCADLCNPISDGPSNELWAIV